MTRYMGERDFGKALAAEHEGIQSLAKRPAPVSSSALNLPWVRRVRRNTNLLVGTGGSGVNITFDDAGSEAHATVAGSTDWQTYFNFFSTSQTQVLVKGVYSVSAQWRVDESVSTGALKLVLNDGFSYPAKLGEHTIHSGDNAPQVAGTHVHRYPALQTLSLTFEQTTGSDKNIDTGYFEIMYLGPYTGPDPSDLEE